MTKSLDCLNIEYLRLILYFYRFTRNANLKWFNCKRNVHVAVG